jgi:hypothetical protein
MSKTFPKAKDAEEYFAEIVENLLIQIRELKKDKERLEWMIENASSLGEFFTSGGKMYINTDHGIFESPRDAIDKAMESENGTS